MQAFFEISSIWKSYKVPLAWLPFVMFIMSWNPQKAYVAILALHFLYSKS